MQMTQRNLKRVNIYASRSADGGYIGKKTVPECLGFVYANVFPDTDKLVSERNGKTVNSGATLILRRGAGVCCGDLAGIYGEEPDSRVLEVSRYPGHITVRTERL